MQNTDFLVVNAFTMVPFSGNPAAVFTHASGLPDGTMQALARQLNLVETVFVLTGDAEADFCLRYFTPHAELPVAGHPTIAAWLALVHEQVIDVTSRTSYKQKNRAGIQEIKIEQGEPGDISATIVTMKQPAPKFLNTSCSKEQVAVAFGITPDDIEPELPIAAVDTGLGHLIIPLKSLDALMRVQRQIEPLRNLCQSANVREAQLFCFEVRDKSSDLHTRNICPREGLEDPACGVGNGALAAYLSKFVWPTKSEIKLKIEQGIVVQRPATIHTRIVRNQDIMEVFIGGSGVVMLQGHFLHQGCLRDVIVP